ncbi:MAG: VWA domain-containing protein [Clostridia bacterium]|nr:VWA domain-containing protein [Clostridia bacterium]
MSNNKVIARVVSMFLVLTILTFCIPLASVSAIDTPDSIQQIEYTGGWNPKEYPVSGTLYKDRVAVSKTIAPTKDENYFDITLKIVAKPRVIDQSVDVVVVMDVSNTMNSTHQGLGVGAVGYDVKDARLTHAKAAVNSFLDLYAVDENISTDRRFGLVTFNSYANTVVPLTTLNTAEKAAGIKTTVNAITAPTGNRERFTNIEGGLQLAQNLLSQSDAAFKYIIFITDGFPTTYIESGRQSLAQIVGYDTYMTGAYNASKVGTDGYFADSVTGKVCTYGVNYSDKAADKADDVAAAIKKSGINIFSIGIDVGVQSIPDYLNSAKNTTHTTVDRTSNSHVIGNSTESYKAWLRDAIAGGPMIEEAEDTEDIHRYASGNSNTELLTAFENILEDIKLIPAETMEEAYTLDPMSDYVEFINFYNPDGSETDAVINTKNGKDIATFNTETETIKWWLTTTQNFYIDNIGNYVLSVSYKVRLKNEMEGFEFYKAFPTNDTTTFYFKTVDFSTGETLFGDNSIDYHIPEVEGYFGNFSFTKRDSLTGHPLEGAVFTLEHYGESCHVCSGDAVIETLTASSDEQGVVSFENLPSGHEYALIETQPPEGYQPGAIHSVHIAYGKTYLDGKLVTEASPAVITNNHIIPARVRLSAQKTLEGRELKSGEFTFVLEGEYINKFHERMHNDENGKVEFFEIIFDDEGTYNFKVYEERGKDSSVVYDTAVYDIEFNVTLSDDGKEYLIETKINGKDIENDTEPAPFEFVNTLRKSVDVTLGADKLFDGKAPEDGMFNFELKDAEGNIIDTKSTVNGTATFDEITYTKEGVYRYTINESHECTLDEADTKIFFDHNVYDAVVTVTAPEDSDSYKAEVEYFLNGEEVDKAVFENLTRSKATLKINALKTFAGRDLADNEFTFELRKISGKILDKSTNDAEGNISFETLEFNQAGYFVFLISEAKGTDTEVVYDESVYKIFVTSEAHHNLSSYYLEATVYESKGDEVIELAHMHGVDLEVAITDGIKFENTVNTTEPTSTVTIDTKPTENTKVTEPVKTEPTETTKVTEPVKTEPTETTKATEPVKTEPTETTKVTEPVKTEPTETTKVTEPVKTEPTEPTKTTEPAETTIVTEPQATEPKATEPQPTEKPEQPDIVITGDAFNPALWIAVLFVAGGMSIITAKVYKRKEE